METLRLSASSVENSHFKKSVSGASSSVSEGKSLQEAFNSINMFPEEFSYILSTDEVSGKIDQSLQKYLESLEDDFEQQLKTFSVSISFMIMSFVSLFLGYQIFSGLPNIF